METDAGIVDALLIWKFIIKIMIILEMKILKMIWQHCVRIATMRSRKQAGRDMLKIKNIESIIG
jgi:hypothetical protein